MSRRTFSFRAFFSGEAAGAILLVGASLLALLLANVSEGVGHAFHMLMEAETGPVLSPAIGPMNVHLWINDGLMAIFFLLVGLEIKREWMIGGLSCWNERRLPIIAAGAGMICPALVYLACTSGDPSVAAGWAIPAATDIAFAIGIMSLLGSRVPPSLKLLLTAIAIVDDMGAVAIIALVYTHGLDLTWIAVAMIVLAGMSGMSHMGVRSVWPYLIGFALLWYAMLLSGVHATVAGVLAAVTVPLDDDDEAGPLHRLEHTLHPWTTFFIIPVFGLANAGIRLDSTMLSGLRDALPLGIALGLFIGKQVGIFGSIWAAVRLGIAPKPRNASWAQVHGMAVLCGIGFTMSLFIGGLAFPGEPMLAEEAKGGTLLGTLVSAIAGYLLLRRAAPAMRPTASDSAL